VTAGDDAMPFRVAVVRSGRRAVIRLDGELDYASAPEFERVVDDLLADNRPDIVVVESARLTFADVVGAGLLIDTADRMAPDGQLVVRDAGQQLVHVLTLLERADILG
jgi:anti-anti-sigma factor